MTTDEKDESRPPGWRHEALIVSVIMLALICGLFWKAIFTDKVMSQADSLLCFPPWRSTLPADTHFWPGNGLLGDQGSQFIPWRHFAVDSVRRGVLPLWNPYAYCGAPFVANDQSAIFYPLTGLHYILPFYLATLLNAIIRLYVAGIGMHYLLRRFGLRPGSALVGGIGYLFCGSTILWLNHPHTNVTVLMPMLFLLTDKFIEDRPRALWAGLWALLVGVQFLGGHLESSFNVLFPCGLFFAWRMVVLFRRNYNWKDLRRPVAAGALASLLGLMIGAIQLLPTFEYLQHSVAVVDRSGAQTKSDFYWRCVPTLVMPKLYGSPVRNTAVKFHLRYQLLNFNERSGDYVGVPMMLLAGVMITACRRRRHTLFFLVLLLLGFCLAYRVPGVYQTFLTIPGFKLMEPMLSRLRLLMAFSFCVLGAYGLDELTSHIGSIGKKHRQARKPAGTALLVGLSVLAFCALVTTVIFYRMDSPNFARTASMLRPGLDTLKGFPQYIATGFIIATAVFLGIMILCILTFRFGPRLLGNKLWMVWAILVTASLLYFAYDYNPIVDAKLVMPETASINYLKTNIGEHRIWSPNVVFPPNASTRYGIRDIMGYDAIEVSDYMSDYMEFLHHPSRDMQAELRTMGIKYYLSHVPCPDLPARLVHAQGMYLYELNDYTSRVQLVGQAMTFTGGERKRILAPLTRSDFDPRRFVVLWEAGDTESVRREGRPGQAGTATITVDDVNEVVVRTDVKRPGYLVLADTHFPGWHVRVDGRQAELLKANFTFRAVKLEPGTHTVRFYYRPMSFILGLVITALGLIVCTGWMVIWGRKRKAETA